MNREIRKSRTKGQTGIKQIPPTIEQIAVPSLAILPRPIVKNGHKKSARFHGKMS
jgi:hypothetical protein